MLKPRSKLFVIGSLITKGSSKGSATITPLAGGFFLAVFSAAAFLSSSSFRFLTSSSVSSLSKCWITIGLTFMPSLSIFF
jgi:hypothetical protein